MHVCRVTEGRLFDYICHKQQFVEAEAAGFIYQLLDAVHYLHSCYIAHLDIKVQFVLLLHLDINCVMCTSQQKS